MTLRRAMLVAALCAAGGCRADPAPDAAADAPAEGAPTVLPATLEAGRFYVHPVTPAGDSLTFFTDTGGGLFIFAGAARRLGILVAGESAVSLPPFSGDAGIPAPLGAPGQRIPLMGSPPPRAMTLGDGMLGQEWFADRVWTFDYPEGRLLLWPDDRVPSAGPPEHQVSLGFRTDAQGARATSFPRLRIAVDGDSLDVLFDTGATVRLTDAATAALGGADPAIQATSFMSRSVVERWLARHPDWRVVPDADQNVAGMRMVEVPEMSVAGWTVGPVWFTERPDRNFHDFMSSFMDRQVEGALGGSGLGFFRVTVDYPRAVATFERP